MFHQIENEPNEPRNDEQRALIAAYNHEMLVHDALGSPAHLPDQPHSMDQRRFEKVTRRERDAVRVRLAYLRTKIRFTIGFKS